MFTGGIKPEADGSYFIDYDVKHFTILLNYIRNDFRDSNLTELEKSILETGKDFFGPITGK